MRDTLEARPMCQGDLTSRKGEERANIFGAKEKEGKREKIMLGVGGRSGQRETEG